MAKDFYIFYMVMADDSSLISRRFARERDALKLAEDRTKTSGIPHFVLEAKHLFETRAEMSKLYTDWDEINRLNDADVEKSHEVIAPAPAPIQPASAAAEMDRDSARALAESGMMPLSEYVEKYGADAEPQF